MRNKLTTSKFGLVLVGWALLVLVFTGCPMGTVSATDVYIHISDGDHPPNPIFLMTPGPEGQDGFYPPTVQLLAEVYPPNADNVVKNWNSNDGSIATVSNDGLVTAISPGLAIITLTVGNLLARANVYVDEWAPPSVQGSKSGYAGDLLILQAGAAAAGAIGRTFVELYNTTNQAINMNNFTLQHADGTGRWFVIPLTGKTIPANSSFLIVGELATLPETRRLQISDAEADMVVPGFNLNNRAFRLALMENQHRLTVPNPSNMGGAVVDMRDGMPPADVPCSRTIGYTAAGLIDLLGVVNEWGDPRDVIYGAEASPAFRISQQVAIRRVSLNDTNNNFNDFRLIDYREWSGGNPYRLTGEQVYIFRPRGSSFYPRNIQFPEPGQEFDPGPGTERLLILQANRSGNNNGGGGGFPRALVELFNNTDSPIDLVAGNFYLHIGDATDWTHVIPLAGTIPSQSSFLIASTTDTNPVYRADLPAADQYAEFSMGAANNWRVALMINQSELLTVDNPFTEASLSAYYVDMLGVGSATAFETQAAPSTQPQGPRRISLEDTDNNNADFSQADFRGHWEGTARTPNAGLYRIWPRNASAGEWNPVSGVPAVHPTVRDPATGDIEFPVVP